MCGQYCFCLSGKALTWRPLGWFRAYLSSVAGKFAPSASELLVEFLGKQKLVYEYVYPLGFADAQGHMKFESTGPNTSRMIWTYWIRPTSDANKTRAAEFLNKVWGPFITFHCTPNFKVAADALYAGDDSYRARP